jgi:predicted nucleotidyltransferase
MYKEKNVNLLLTCLGTRNDQFITSSSQEFTESDWSEFIKLSSLHGVAPILYKLLQTQRSKNNIPGWVIRKLRVLYVLNATKQNDMLNEFSKVFRKLNGDGVSFIVLKGPHLAEVVYRDWALRPMGDLDILVNEEDLSKASSSLQEIGYSNRKSESPHQHHHLPQFLKEGAAPIEIHLGISSTWPVAFTADYDGLWERAQRVKIGGVEILVLSLEDLILNLSLHACQHNFRIRLMHIYDISQTLRQYKSQINWVELVSRAHLWNSIKALYLTLEVTHDLLGISVPEEVMKNLGPQDYNAQFLKGAEVQILSLESSVTEHFAEILETKTLLAKLKLIWGRLFSRETLAYKYRIDKNQKLIGFYYILHWSDMMARSVRVKAQMLRHGKNRLIYPNKKMALALSKWLSTV